MLAEGRFGLIKLAHRIHAWRLLSRKHEQHRAVPFRLKRRPHSFERRVLQARHRVFNIPTDDRAPMVECAPPDLERIGDVGQWGLGWRLKWAARLAVAAS